MCILYSKAKNVTAKKNKKKNAIFVFNKSVVLKSVFFRLHQICILPKRENHIKGCVHYYIFGSLFCMSKREHL